MADVRVATVGERIPTDVAMALRVNNSRGAATTTDWRGSED